MTDGERLIEAALRGEAVRWPASPPPGLDTAVIDSADDHGVAPLLATVPSVASWPPPVRSSFTSAHRFEAACEIARREALVGVLTQFARAGIRSLLLKGAQLAYTHYRRPWLRPRLDTDLLVAPGDRSRANEVLQTMGYRPGTHFGGELVTHQRLLERDTPNAWIDVLDLHWKIANPHVFADALTFEELDRDAVPIAGLGPNARGLSDVHAFVLACIHRVAHHRNSERLIWLYDIHLLARGMGAERRAQAAELATATRLRSVCESGLATALARFPAPVQDGWLAPLEATGAGGREPSAAFLRSGWRPIDTLDSDLRALGGWKAKSTLIREHLFPPVAYIRRAYDVSSPALVSLAYVHRIATGAGRWILRRATRE